MSWSERVSAWGPVLLAATATVAVHLYVQPTGEFPLNDDFTYARVARHFAETGALKVDLPSAASIIGQAVLVSPILRLFGFSHLALRLISMGLGLLGLALLNALLRVGSVRWQLRALVLLTMALNPLYLYVSTTFMTELYGHLPALAGVLIWFRGRQASHDNHEASLVTPLRAIAVGTLIGLTFWTRQYCVVAFPAIVASTFWEFRRTVDRPRLRRSLMALAAGSICFALVVLLYFPWARWSGNFRPEFKTPLDELLRIDALTLFLEPQIFISYMTAFFLPVLVLFARRHSVKVTGLVAMLLLTAQLAGWWLLQRHAMSDSQPGEPIHRVFPFGGNVLYDFGVGPVTLTDVYQLRLTKPQAPASVFQTVQWVILVGAGLWAAVLVRPRRERVNTTRFDGGLSTFLVVFIVLSLAIPLQAYKLQAFDRYYLPCMLALAVWLGIRLEEQYREAQTQRPGRVRLALYSVLLAPVAVFSAVGLHNEFRVNEVRWQLVGNAQRLGAAATNIDAGYEVSGWLAYDDFSAGRMPSTCIGECGCSRGWFCLDASYHVGMNALSGYELVETVKPAYALFDGPPLMLLRRLPNISLTRFTLGGLHGATVRPPPEGSTIEQRYRLFPRQTGATAALHECSAPGTASFVSRDSTCEGQMVQGIAGYLLDTAGPLTKALLRCQVNGTADLFVSTDPACEGQTVDRVLGYVTD